ncbi:MAG TPA: hypothetical protein VJH23_01650 [archaeon]|nr:hypothetical protein [archaeon]
MRKKTAAWMHGQPQGGVQKLPQGLNPHMKGNQPLIRKLLLAEAHDIIAKQRQEGKPIQLPAQKLAKKYGVHTSTISTLSAAISQEIGARFTRGGRHNVRYPGLPQLLEKILLGLEKAGKQTVKVSELNTAIAEKIGKKVAPSTLYVYFKNARRAKKIKIRFVGE